MSASDHLNPDQFFMPMKDILRMPSGDAMITSRAQNVGQVIKEKGIPDYMERHPQDYEEVRQSMVEHGQTEPLPLFTTRYGVTKLGDGHHRVHIAQQLGWPGMNVRHDSDHPAAGGER